MSRVIKVEDQVYDQLDQLRDKGETFSQIIEDLLSARLEICQILNILEGHLKYKEWQEQRLRELTPRRGFTETMFINPERD